MIPCSSHQAQSPVFSRFNAPDPDDELRQEYARELAAEDEAFFIASRDGRAVGGASVAPVERSSRHVGVARPADAAILGFAATTPEERGSGTGLALTNAVFTWARERSFRTIVVDWRVTNLLSSRFWPRRGFRTTFLRLYRSIP